MTIRNRTVQMVDGRTKHFALIADDHEGDKDEFRQMFLELLVGNPRLLEVGGRRFDDLRLFHDGRRWVAEVISVAPRVNP